MAKNILSEEQTQLLLSIFHTAKDVLILGHKNPDGDSLGASLALAQILRDVYHVRATVVVPDSYPDYLQWLPNSHTALNYEKQPDEVATLFGRADHIFCLDFNEESRVGLLTPLLTSATQPKIMIDHHLDPDPFAKLTISCPTACSTCEILFHIATQLGIYSALDSSWDSYIYCGMMTDTGGFTYNSSRAEIYEIISQLIARGIDKDKIYRAVYNNYSSWAVRFRGYIMSQKLNIFDDLHASYFAISKEEMRQFHFIKGDAEGLVNVPLTIKNMRLSISLREDDRQENCVWVSIRSVGNFPANRMAEEFFAGGGHKNAAGGHLECSLAMACDIVRQAIKTYAEQLKK